MRSSSFGYGALQPGTGADCLGRPGLLLQRQLLKAWLDQHHPEVGQMGLITEYLQLEGTRRDHRVPLLTLGEGLGQASTYFFSKTGH